MNELPITTANELPGQRISENLGVAFGLVVRSVGFAKGFTAGIKALRQGEVSEYTELLEDSRRHALDRLVQNAQLLGANSPFARAAASDLQLAERALRGTQQGSQGQRRNY